MIENASDIEVCDICKEREATRWMGIGSRVRGKSCTECQTILEQQMGFYDLPVYEERHKLVCDDYVACVFDCEDTVEMSVQMCFCCYQSSCFGGECEGATIRFLQ